MLLFISFVCGKLSNNYFTSLMQQGYRQDALNDTFWLMTFTESTYLVVCQVLANWALVHGSKKSLISPSVITMLLAAVNLAFTMRWSESPARGRIKEHRAAFFAYIFGGKIIYDCVAVNWLL